jgi:predicted HTH transcriptional regulator
MPFKIQEIIRRHENETLDFKRNAGNYAKIARTLCAFSNTSGGILAIGITDQRLVFGVDPEEQKFLIEKAGVLHCDPYPSFFFEELEEDPEVEGEEPKMILLVHVAESEDKPVFYISKGGERIVYIRVGDKSLPASPSIVKRLTRGLPVKQEPVWDGLGRHEKRLFAYLANHERVTVKDFASMANLSRQRAGKIITALVLEGMLREHSIEKTTFYTL